jgi:hypothetical protein
VSESVQGTVDKMTKSIRIVPILCHQADAKLPKLTRLDTDEAVAFSLSNVFLSALFVITGLIWVNSERRRPQAATIATDQK